MKIKLRRGERNGNGNGVCGNSSGGGNGETGVAGVWLPTRKWRE